MMPAGLEPRIILILQTRTLRLRQAEGTQLSQDLILFDLGDLILF